MINSKVYSSNTNRACPAATAITCRPSTVNEVGADLVYPPSETRQTSRPVSASTAKHTPPRTLHSRLKKRCFERVRVRRRLMRSSLHPLKWGLPGIPV